MSRGNHRHSLHMKPDRLSIPTGVHNAWLAHQVNARSILRAASAGNCNCYLITLQISYLNLPFPPSQPLFLCLSFYHYFSYSPSAYVCTTKRTRPSCLFGRGDSCIKAGVCPVRVHHRYEIDNQWIDRRNVIVDVVRVFDPSAGVLLLNAGNGLATKRGWFSFQLAVI